jgi:hypothetical protein
MAKLIVKPTVNFLSTDSDSQLMTHVGAIISALTNNVDYPNPVPSLTVVADALQAFEVAFSGSSLGGMLLTRIKNAKRIELVSLVRQLANYVALMCKSDLVTLLGSGFPVHKPTRSSIGQLPTPNMPVLKHGPHSGELDLSTKSVRGAFIYNWQIALFSKPDVVIQTVQSTGTKASVSGLTPGQIYNVQVNAVGAAGPGPFSNPASLMAI